MLYALIADGQLQRVVDSPTDLDRMPFEQVKQMCQQLQVPTRGVDRKLVQVVPIRPAQIVRWDLPC